MMLHIDGLVQDRSNSIANALELLQSCTKPSIWSATVSFLSDIQLKISKLIYLWPGQSLHTFMGWYTEV